MEKNKLYITKALKIFKQEGLRLSIDDLASKMGISKKTLYNHFRSKESLLGECLHEVFSELDQDMKMMHDESKNAIECMQQSFFELNLFFKDHSPIFINDLNKLYPEMISSKHTLGFGQFQEKMILNLQKGIREGLYLEDINVEMISEYFRHSVFGFFFHSLINNNDFSASLYFETIVNYNLRALVTEKGRKLLT